MAHHQKQESNGSSFGYEVKEEGEFPLRSYQHELESHMVAPGTVIAEECQPGNFTRILIPHPSADPQDPLNWPSWLKHSALIVACFFVFLGTYASSGFSALLFPYAEFLQISTDQAALLTNYNILGMAICNFFWVPLALVFGKRPVIIAALGVLFASSIWGGYATSYSSTLGARILQGFGGGAVEALGPTIVADRTYPHLKHC
jgi:Major Facilitator Superfamily